METPDQEGVLSGDAQDDLDAQNAAIARRAYEISLSDSSGTPEENWWRAAAEINQRTPRETSDG
jgi:hypothetical protein